MTFRVEITAAAEKDADLILEWLLSQRAGETGLRWYEALREAIGSLAEFPERCSLAPESASFPFEVRHLLYGRAPHVYRILFTIEDNTVHPPYPPWPATASQAVTSTSLSGVVVQSPIAGFRSSPRQSCTISRRDRTSRQDSP